jgi:hypothetical protein
MMAYSSPVLSRRTLLRGIGASGTLAVTAAALDWGNGENATVHGPYGPSATGQLVMIIRHGGKRDKSNSLLDIGGTGNTGDNSLTQAGWRRAHKLADLFAPRQGPIRPGLARPTVIYAAGPNDAGGGERTRETLGPLAERLGIPVNTKFGKGDEKALVKQVRASPGPTLICWQRGEIPSIVDAFGPVSPNPPRQWPDKRFDMVWTLLWTLTGTTENWNLAQVPEMVLPGDQATLIN